MKKGLLMIMGVIILFSLSGCQKIEGDYKEGTYTGYVTDSYGGENNEAIAVVYVGKSGLIESVYLDTTYKSGDAITTKKSLGDNYNMKKYSNATKEWYEQINLLEKKVIEKQGLDFITWTDAERSLTDSVSGVTIKINALYEALNNALKQAKQ